jgi:phage baseplate assembly protein W
MPDSSGISAATMRPLSDWAHTQQSVRKILLTPIGSRVMRRDFGSRVFDYIDSKMYSRNVLGLYAAAAEAIEIWEPRYRMTRGSVTQATAGGVIQLDIFGTYYPRGHLGDYSIAEDASVRVLVYP